MPIPASILERVATFGRNLESYLHSDYKETQLRREFLDPLFDALGWDVANRAGYAEAYKDVVHEDSLKISGVGASAPDYSFRIGGTRKFFVEAKKPSVRIKDDPAPAAQLRRYSYSAKLPLGIVTDFQEFAIYDTRQRPRETDKASAGRIFYCTFEQFAEKWDEIAVIFSRDAVLRGSFDKFASATRGKRGTSEFDDDFLADMERWRDLLARNLALRNTLTQRELNFAVQRILDRIIFLRIAEDRGIEPYGQLQALTAGPKIYPRLGQIFERADFRYNSGLFHFATEKGRDESPDKLTLALDLDDAVLKEIIGALYWPKSPYAFAVIPADILGHVYEQFLGKVIHLTSDHKARVEEKPEVRKAGGVYYTPTYIVDYIVRQAVGPLVAGKTPKQVEKLTVLDPACGSGSFLLGAYEFLLAWHLDYYLKHDPAGWAKKKSPPIYETAPNAHGIGQGAGNWLLTTAERKRILVNNLFGVDIDAQAVEVTKLSLLLKVLEGEARELRGKQLDFHRVLPDLGNNIKCGNSLIGSDFYAQPNLPAFDEEARYKLNAFDWDREFKPILDRGGFDAVIGNPPYVQIENIPQEHQKYYLTRYGEDNKLGKRFDLYQIFVMRGVQLLSEYGRVGMILPNTFLMGHSYELLRRRLVQSGTIGELVDLPQGVFKRVTVDNVLFFFQRNPPSVRQNHKISVRKLGSKGEKVRIADEVWDESFELSQSSLTEAEGWRININRSPVQGALFQKIERGRLTLGDITESSQGIILYRTAENADANKYTSREQRVGWKKLLRGRNIGRYEMKWTGEWVHYGDWLWRAREKKFFSQPKILLQAMRNKALARRLIGTLDLEAHYNAHNLASIILRPGSTFSLSFLLGIFNSAAINCWYRAQFPNVNINPADFRRIPLPALNFEKKADRAAHDTLVAHVGRMLQLHADLATAKSPDAQTHRQRDIAATDRAIDQLVYQLYDLTPGEIALIEQATAPVVPPPVAEPDDAAPAPPPPPEAYAQAEAAASHHYFAKESPPPPP